MSQDGETVAHLRSRIAPRLNVRHKVRFGSSLAAALLMAFFNSLRAIFIWLGTLEIRQSHGMPNSFHTLLSEIGKGQEPPLPQDLD